MTTHLRELDNWYPIEGEIISEDQEHVNGSADEKILLCVILFLFLHQLISPQELHLIFRANKFNTSAV